MRDKNENGKTFMDWLTKTAEKDENLIALAEIRLPENPKYSDIIGDIDKTTRHYIGWLPIQIRKSYLEIFDDLTPKAHEALNKGNEQEVKRLLGLMMDNRDRVNLNILVRMHKRQAASGAKGAEGRWPSERPDEEIIKQLASKLDQLGDPLPAKDLWCDFHSCLDEKGLHPHDTSGANVKDTDRMTWSGNSNGLTFKTFKNLLSRNRK